MIVRYKTAYYTFYLPCAIGMIYAGVKDAASYRLARDICCRIGEFFQIQDDYLDCFGDPKVIGKVGWEVGWEVGRCVGLMGRDGMGWDGIGWLLCLSRSLETWFGLGWVG